MLADASTTASGFAAEELGSLFEALGNPTRVALLHRLSSPAFAPELGRELKMTRQAVRKHLAALAKVGLVNARPSRRGALPATLYSVSPSGLFMLKERVRGLAIRGDAKESSGAATVSDARGRVGRAGAGAGLLLIHGDAPGRWLPLARGTAWTLGRDPDVEIPFAYDPYASARHAVLSRDAELWTLTDLHSRNGTFVDFEPLAAGATRAVAAGSVLTIGHSQVVLKTGA